MAFSSKGLADSGDFGIPAELGFRLLKENGGVHMEAGSMDWCWRIGTPSAVTTATAESSLIHLLSGTVPTIREHELAKGGDGYGFSTFLANLWHPNLALCPPTDIVTTRIESPSSSSSNNITTANANTNTNTNTNTCVIESRGDSQVVPMKSHTSFHNDIIHCLGSSNLRLQTRESSEEARMETPQHFSCIGNYYTHASNIAMPEEENNGYLGQARNASTQLLNNPLQFDNSQKKAGQFTLMDSHRPLQIVDDVSSTIQELGNINPAIQDLGNINLASPLDCTYTAPDVATNWQDHHLPCGKTKEADRNNVESLPWVNTYLANDDDTTTSNKEMVYRAAALMQPPASCYIGPVLADSLIAEARSTLRPKRKNVKISDDPQSVAARKRRHRISQKIEILQRMVPGGTKMDTASMLDEAVQYMKFLKAQVQMMEQLQQGLVHFPAPPPSHPLSSSPIPFAESNPPGMNPNSSFALPRSSPPSLL